LGFITERRIANPIVISGDVHNNWLADLKADFSDPDSPTVGTEFVGTSISSGGDGADTNPRAQGIVAENSHMKYFNGQRGYVRCIPTPGELPGRLPGLAVREPARGTDPHQGVFRG
jgi:alkaline phosphatase D